VPDILMKELLEAGVHFGHQRRRWNPKMARYIFTERNDIYILDLQKTVRQMKRAGRYLKNLVLKGGRVLMVSTKKQAQEIMQVEADRAGLYYVNHRWLGGTLTNFQTISKRIRYLNDLDRMQEEGVLDRMIKKERSRLMKQKAKLERYFTGIKSMTNLPDCLFVVDPRREHIPVLEARKLGIPVVAIVDTNCDPDEVDIVIPGNDDAIRSIKLITKYLIDCIVEGKTEMDAIREKVIGEDGEAPSLGQVPVLASASPEFQDSMVAEAAPAEVPFVQVVVQVPVVTEPVVTEPVVTEPVVTEPAGAEAVAAEPVAETAAPEATPAAPPAAEPESSGEAAAEAAAEETAKAEA